MSSRSVSVVLTAQVQNYLSNMRSAEQHTRDVERAARSATEQFRIHNESLAKVGVGMAAVGGAAALGLGIAIKASTEYGAKLAQLQSLSHASQGEMAALSAAAMKQGQAFGYSATQVADAEIELTKAGRSTAQMLGGDLKGALALAAAGQMDVAEATSIGVTAITQFAASGATIPHTADLLAAGADKALGSVKDLGDALKQGGLVSAQMGLSLDDTVGTLSAFAQAGLIGSDAGTSLKTMLLSLQSPSSQAESYLKKYNITAYDSQGAFVGITNLAGQLHDKLGNLSQAQRDAALSTIFGSDAIRSANVLYTQGAAGIGKWIHDVNDAGFASAQAAGKLNSLQGDLQKLSAAFQTDMIKAGQSSDGFLRGGVQGLTGFITLLGDVPAPAQAAATGATAVVAAVALVGGTALIAIPKINAARVAISELGLTGRGVAGMIGKGSALLLGLGAVVGGFAALGEHGTASVGQVKQAAKDLETGWAGIDKRFGATSLISGGGLKQALTGLSDANGGAAVAKFFDGMTGGISHLSDTYKASEATLDAMGQQLGGLAQQDYGSAAESFATLARSQHLTATQTHTLLGEMKPYRDQLASMARQAGVATDDQTLLNVAQGKGAASARVLAVQQTLAANGGAKNAAALQVMRGAADQATSSVDDLANAIEGLDKGQLSARSAARGYQKALDDATAAIAKNGKTANKLGTDLDITTDKGRDNQTQLDGIADATKTWAASMTKAHAPVSAVNKVLEDGKKQYSEAAQKMGLTKGAADRLAEALLGIPKVVQPRIALTGAGDALDKLGAFEAAVNRLNGRTAFVDVAVGGTPGTGRARKAAGGAIDGPGPQGVDSVPALLAPGEHVLTTSDVARMGGQGGVYAFRASLAGGVQAYAKGGAVKRKKGLSSADLVNAAIRVRGPVGADGRKKPKTVTFGGIYDQTKKASGYLTQQRTAQKALDRARATLKRQEAAAKAAQKALDKARDAAAAIHGKGTSAAKHAATMRVRRLTKANKTAQDRVKATEKKITADTTTRDDAKDKRTAALAAAATLRLGREDFQSAERRNPGRNVTDPLAYVDQLRQMSRDDTFSPTRRKAMDAAANKYEAQLVSLTEKSAKAAEKLDGLKNASVQLHDSIAQAVSGGYRASASFDPQGSDVAGGWVTRNGMRFRQTTHVAGAPTAAGLTSYYSKGAAAAKRFADDLGKLAARGYPDALVAEVAGYGVEAGQPIVAALLSASRSQQSQISSGFNSIGSSAGRAGTIVANDTYAAPIAAAKANADQITGQIKTDGEALRKLIARAFGLTGYAGGTTNASGGIHWVGEDGPELVGFRGGEAVLNRADSARWVRGAAGSGGSSGEPVVVQVPAFPDTITVQDASGFRATMRVVAHEVVSQRNDQLAVRLMGAA